MPPSTSAPITWGRQSSFGAPTRRAHLGVPRLGSSQLGCTMHEALQPPGLRQHHQGCSAPGAPSPSPLLVPLPWLSWQIPLPLAGPSGSHLLPLFPQPPRKAMPCSFRFPHCQPTTTSAASFCQNPSVAGPGPISRSAPTAPNAVRGWTEGWEQNSLGLSQPQLGPNPGPGTSKCPSRFPCAPDAPSHFLLDSRLAPFARISKTECKNRGRASPKHNSKLFPGKVTGASQNSSGSRGK